MSKKAAVLSFSSRSGILFAVALIMACSKTNNGASSADSSNAPANEKAVPGLQGALGQRSDATLAYIRNDVGFDLAAPDSELIDEDVDCDKPEDCANSQTIHLLIVAEKNAH